MLAIKKKKIVCKQCLIWEIKGNNILFPIIDVMLETIKKVSSSCEKK